jgi:hypothetical protein
MRFEATHRFQGTLEQVEAAMLDKRYLDFLLKHHGVLLEAELLGTSSSGSSVSRQVRYRPKPVIESIGPKKVPPEWFAFVEESTYDTVKHQLKFKNRPTSKSIASLMVNTGTLTLRSVAGQCERSMDGEISLKLPFLLKPLAMIGEAVIQREGLKILDNELPVMNRFIQEVLSK